MVYAKAKQTEVLLKWIPQRYLSNSGYKLYRSVEGGEEELIAELKPLSYELLVDRGYSEEYRFYIYPQRDIKNFDDRLRSFQSRGMTQAFRILKLMQDNQFAANLGQFYADKDVKEKQVYIYRIEQYLLGKKVAQKRVRVDMNKMRKFSGISWVKAEDLVDGVSLSWDTFGAYGYYHVYRKLQDEKSYRRLTETPLYISPKSVGASMYKDSTINMGQLGSYYVRKIDIFGDEGVPSTTVFAKRYESLVPTRVDGLFIKSSDKKMIIRWKEEPNAMAYNVYRSIDARADYKKITPKPITSELYVDEAFDTNRDYYYAVTAVNMYGESSPSLPYLATSRDATPPTRPTDLNVTTQAGKVKLTWKASQDKNLLGYRIYMSMDKNALWWSRVTPEDIKGNSFVHIRPKSLSRNPYYYRVTAVDTKFNESKASNIVKVKLPDVVAPKQPTISSYSINPERIRLEWTAIEVYDLDHYNLYRKEAKVYVKLNHMPLYKRQFVDKKPRIGENVYLVTAVDKKGNESVRTATIALKSKNLTPVTIESLSFKKVAQGVEVSFRVNDKDYMGFELLRSSGKDPKYYNISGLQKGKKFLDKTVMKGQHYYYTIKAYDKSGNIVESDVVEIKIKG